MALFSDKFVLYDGADELHCAYLQSLGEELFGQSRVIQLGFSVPLDACQSSLSHESMNIDSIANLVMGVMTALSQNKPILLQRDPKVPLPEQLPHGACVGIQTSGTTGQPKWVFHSLKNLLKNLPEHGVGSLKRSDEFSHMGSDVSPVQNLAENLHKGSDVSPVQNLAENVHKGSSKHPSKWLLSYHPYSFAGLQVLLYTMKNGLGLCFTAMTEEHISFAVKQRVNALSITPSLFKVYSLAPEFTQLPLSQITFGGEICTQDTLDLAARLFPNSQICHVYATTETGTLFRINDGLAGFPVDYLEKTHKGWQIIIEEGRLHCISAAKDAPTTLGQSIDTGDLVEQTVGRIHFLGREDNVVNVGGDKVNLETLEQEILRLTNIQDARVFAKANSITGHIIGVELVALDDDAAKAEFSVWSQKQKKTAQPRIVQWVTDVSLSHAKKKTRQEPCAT